MPSELLHRRRYGEDIIIGVIDTGTRSLYFLRNWTKWFGSEPCLRAPLLDCASNGTVFWLQVSGRSRGAPATKGTVWCRHGGKACAKSERAGAATTAAASKIIGARFYSAGVDEEDLKMDFLTPRDKDGHGTHTASTASGSVVEAASFHGLAAGAAPRARIAV
jgi:hypothetical protein